MADNHETTRLPTIRFVRAPEGTPPPANFPASQDRRTPSRRNVPAIRQTPVKESAQTRDGGARRPRESVPRSRAYGGLKDPGRRLVVGGIIFGAFALATGAEIAILTENKGGAGNPANIAYPHQPLGINTSDYYIPAITPEAAKTPEQTEFGKPGTNIRWIYYGWSEQEFPVTFKNGQIKRPVEVYQNALYSDCLPRAIQQDDDSYNPDNPRSTDYYEQILMDMGAWSYDSGFLIPDDGAAIKRIGDRLGMHTRLLFGYGETRGEDKMTVGQKLQTMIDIANAGHMLVVDVPPSQVPPSGHWEAMWGAGPAWEVAAGESKFKRDNQGKYIYVLDSSIRDITWAPNNPRDAFTRENYKKEWGGRAIIFWPKDQSKIKL